MSKPNCYSCKYRGTVPGDHHSSCNHPSLDAQPSNALLQLNAILANVGRMAPIEVPAGELNIKGNPHGIKSGWFNWPYNFDPVWLENCNGFTPKEVTAAKGEGK